MGKQLMNLFIRRSRDPVVPPLPRTLQSMAADVASTFSWTNGSVILAPIVLLYCIYRIARVPNKVERRIRHFTDAVLAHPVVSHRGGYPENTLAGIRLSKEKGFKAVEIDLEYTKDGYPVLLHDPTVNRTSNGTGHVRDMTFAELRELDFGIKFGLKYAGEKIPTLQEAIALCKELGLLIFIDIKSKRFKSAKLLNEICRKDKELYDSIVVVSFYPDLLYLVTWFNPNIVIALAMKDWEFTWDMDGSLRHDNCWRQTLAPLFDVIITFLNYHVLWRLTELPFVGLYKGDLTDEKLNFWRKRGAAVIVWTMAEDEAREFQKTLKVPVMVDVSPLEL